MGWYAVCAVDSIPGVSTPPQASPVILRPRSGHFVINGADGLAFRLADQLTRRYAGDVVVLMTKEQHRVARDFAELPRVEVVVVERVDEKALLEAGVTEASALALTNQDDVANIHIGLQARDVAPNVKLVIRMYNTRLGQAIESLFTDCKVLSDSEIASPALIAVTLDEVAANPVRIGRRTLISARRDAVDERDIVCGLADTSAPGNPALLPTDPSTANLVLAEVRSTANVDRHGTHRQVHAEAALALRGEPCLHQGADQPETGHHAALRDRGAARVGDHARAFRR